MTISDAQFNELRAAVSALEARLGAPDPNNGDDLTTRIKKMQIAFNGIVGENVPGDTGGIVGDLRRRLSALEAKPPNVQQPADVVAQLAALNIHVAPNVMAIGMEIEPKSLSQLQLAGAKGASILGRSNVGGTDGQNPGEVHTNSIHVCDTDGGIRFLQYGYWGKGGFVRNTLNRVFSVFAVDSMGDYCVSKTAVGETEDGGQVFYILFNLAQKFVRLCTFIPGWKMQVREAKAYGATEIDVIAAAVEAALKARGL